MSKIGFIGLGVMGAPMAGNLIAAGHELFLHTRGKVPEALVKAGGVVCASGKEIAERSQIVIIMVPDTPDVEQALFAAGGVSEGLSKGKIVVDMSSISPIATKEFAKTGQRPRRRLSRRAGFGRRGRGQGGFIDDHGRRLAAGL